MPRIQDGIESNLNRLARFGSSPNLALEPPAPGFSIPPIGSPTGLPSRGVLSSNLIIGSDFFAGAQQFRFGQRSSSPPPAQAISKTSTPQSLINKKLISPVIGGGTKLNRYNVIVTTVTPSLVTNGASSSQTFIASGVRAADKLIGYQWATAQVKGVAVLGIRVTGNNSITIDFFNPTAGSLTPTGGTISLFLVQ